MATVYTKQGRRVIELAVREAVDLRHDSIGSVHLLLGILRVDDSVAAPVLRSHGVTHAAVLAEVDRTRQRGEPGFWKEWRRSRNLALTEECRTSLEHAGGEALAHGCLIGPEHLLLGVLCEDHSEVWPLVCDLGRSPDQIFHQVHQMLDDPAGDTREEARG
ncbi:Clp protease N-terminal domain-containing protein [Nocardiopsis lucentensis]|uniref:Clp protease N-terminal domain-containing protein n=1 Tax=Nocardiopsis lucentensis TaxID=53441 RepID=UPI00034D9C93|nr:Clp protease N-terminal domain-containing protein [Nocardiopsis lucentensis]